MKRLPILLIMLLFAGWSVEALAQQKTANGVPVPAPVNVLQDCWSTNLELDPDPEFELYVFSEDEDIDLIWKQKLLVSCSAYAYSIVVLECADGKPRPSPGAVVHSVPFNTFGPVSPIPGVPEPLFLHTIPAGTLMPGRYEWFMVTECDDTSGSVLMPRKDGDIDDQCGINVGLNPGVGLFPVIFGPEPLQAMDPDPGGSPAGRGPGESGTTRPWCFQVTPGTAGEGAAKQGVRDLPSYPGFDARRRTVSKPEDVKRGYFDDQFNLHLLDDGPRLEVQQQQEPVPHVLEFIGNHPNPFDGETTIRYGLTEDGPITMTIYDALGRKVRVLVDEVKTEGEHEVTFDGTGLSAGVYFYHVETSGKTVMGKMIHQD